MATGWRYRLVAVCGAAVWIAGAVVVANTPLSQSLLTAVPPINNLRPTTVGNRRLLGQMATTVIVTIGALWPLFKPRPRRILDTISLTNRRVFVAAAVLATVGYFDWSSRLPRTTLIGTIGFLAVVLPVWFVGIRRRPSVAQRAIIVGDDPEGMATLAENASIPVAGFVAPPGVSPRPRGDRRADGGVTLTQSETLPRLGGLAHLGEILVEHDIDTALLAFAEPDREAFFGALATCFEHGVRAKVHRAHSDYVLVADTAGDTLVDTRLEPWDWQDYVLKRGFDVLFATLALLVLSPLVVGIAAAIRLDSAGPVLYSQTRTTSFGGVFTIYKFRTMRTGTAETAPDADEGHRVTRVGHVLRQTHLDEIPQLWSILVGDMSVVGPRAAWTDEERHIEATTSEWRKRWFVKPGLTGLAQINGTTSETPQEKLRYDIEYIRNQSFAFDLQIVVRQLYSVALDAASLVTNRDR